MDTIPKATEKIASEAELITAGDNTYTIIQNVINVWMEQDPNNRRKILDRAIGNVSADKLLNGKAHAPFVWTWLTAIHNEAEEFDIKQEFFLIIKERMQQTGIYASLDWKSYGAFIADVREFVANHNISLVSKLLYGDSSATTALAQIILERRYCGFEIMTKLMVMMEKIRAQMIDLPKSLKPRPKANSNHLAIRSKSKVKKVLEIGADKETTPITKRLDVSNTTNTAHPETVFSLDSDETKIREALNSLRKTIEGSIKMFKMLNITDYSFLDDIDNSRNLKLIIELMKTMGISTESIVQMKIRDEQISIGDASMILDAANYFGRRNKI